MLCRTIVVGNPAYLYVEHSQLVVALRDAEPRKPIAGLRPPAGNSHHARVPLEDLGILILDGPGIGLSKEVLSKCGARNVALVVTDERRMPSAQLVPYEGHTLAGLVFRKQAAASLPLRKQLWRQIVVMKLREQARAVDSMRRRPEAATSDRRLAHAARRIAGLALSVGSGDPENREGQGASLYFDALFGAEFLRDRDEPGINAMLNYGYAVMRASVARALVGTGLNPSLSVHHANQYNAFGLVDDAMEPLRPMVDLHVVGVVSRLGVPDELVPTVKRALLEMLNLDVVHGGRTVPLAVGLGLYAASLKRVLCGNERRIQFALRKEEA